MADKRTLRIVTAATFLPAFPLCVAHGVISNSPAPAVGLVPLAFSAGAGVFLVSRQSARKQQQQQQQQQSAPDTERGESSEQRLEQEYEQGPDDIATQQSREPSDALSPTTTSIATPTRSHPILVFVADTILAAALMVVLVFTWIDSSSGSTNSAESAMLAAYATVPLLINFLIHLYLAVRELSRGLAIPGLTQWVAWQAVPPYCPDCGRRLRPDSAPRPPWLDEASFRVPVRVRLPPAPPRPNLANLGRKLKQKLKMPALPTVQAPAWLRGRGRGGYAPLFASNEARDDDDDRDHETPAPAPIAPYRDDPEVGETSAGAEDPRAAEPEVVDIVGKKSRKSGRNSSLSPSV